MYFLNVSSFFLINLLTFRRILFLVFILIFINSCVNLSERINLHNYNDLFRVDIVTDNDFKIVTFQKITDPAADFVFYVEGDGRAFIDGYPTSNPTPFSNLTLNFMIQFFRFKNNRNTVPLKWHL